MSIKVLPNVTDILLKHVYDLYMASLVSLMKSKVVEEVV